MAVPVLGGYFTSMDEEDNKSKELVIEVGALCTYKHDNRTVLSRIWNMAEKDGKLYVQLHPLAFCITDELRKKIKSGIAHMKPHVCEAASIRLLHLASIDDRKKKINQKKRINKVVVATQTPPVKIVQQSTTTGTKITKVTGTNVVLFRGAFVPEGTPVRWIGGIPVFNTCGHNRRYSAANGGWVPVDMEEYKKKLT